MKKLLVLVSAISLMAVSLAGAAPVFAQEEEPHIMVQIDIKPGSDANIINLKSPLPVPVALFGSDTFNVRDVKLRTVGLHPMDRPEEAVSPVLSLFVDVNRDGFKDILFFFATRSLTLRTTDTEACLHGDLRNGEHFCGHDSVVVIKCK